MVDTSACEQQRGATQNYKNWGYGEMVDASDLKSESHYVSGSSSLPTPIKTS